ncbi:multicomponent Na+:H+ antiporter subunit D [Peptoclostridium litorale DSM 5388]|uniref:NADH-quinone oxidoreductase subunit N n=1 Tax=Peptoclostridium litorale DSM 5388 TaxID=1121324 RepID=A0A069R9K4_PEPLI|nr:proton-conducting transporter membrane subunit [Peptoclostridium litorale]KDR93744.1 NADH-quinone oxidoreductase subunit N [Peptoclostridium litorale DSM 5388]SIN84993.1 multicomponent Na+:H+ antiporter subunit D [Peptoclostridium litorale DSM 5388]
MNDFLLAVPIIIPFLIFGYILLKKDMDFKRAHRYSLSGGVICIAAILLIIYSNDKMQLEILKTGEFFKIYINIDKIGQLFSTLACILWIFTLIYSMEYMREYENAKIFFAFFSAALGSTIGIAFSGNMLTMCIFYFMLTFSTFPLMAHNEQDGGGIKYLAYSLKGGVLILAGIIAVYTVSPNMDFAASGVSYIESQKLILAIGFVLMFLGFGAKAAMVPFHSWLAQSAKSPTPAGSIFHAALVVQSGIFAIIRISYFIFGAKLLRDMDVQSIAISMAALTVLMGSFTALKKENLKERLTYSTIGQLGYILIGVFMLDSNALTGGILHLVNHALIKIILLFCAGAVYKSLGKQDVSDMKGVGKKMPVTMGCFSIAAVSLIGIPPTNGFVSKWYLVTASIDSGKTIAAAVLLVSAFLTDSYLMPVVIKSFFYDCECNGCKEKGDCKFEQKSDECEMGFATVFSLVALTFAAVAIGVYPSALVGFVSAIVSGVGL